MNNNFNNFSSDDEEDAFSSEGLASLYVLENQMAYDNHSFSNLDILVEAA